MSKAKKQIQLGLFSEETLNQKPVKKGRPKVPLVDKKLDLDSVVLSHGKNFRIEGPYLLSLSKYNNYLKKDWHEDSELLDDNLLLRTMWGGIQNSYGTPPEIFEGLNALEITLIEGGIFKRKYVHLEDFSITPKKNRMFAEPITVSRDLTSHRYVKQSRIYTDNNLNCMTLYETINFLLNASDVKRIYNSYKKEWKKSSKWKNLSKEQKRFKRLNPYDPLTLKERMDYIERKYPEAVEAFKKVLAKPFIPERIVRMDKHGNPIRVTRPEGFITPGKTYRRGVKGMSFYNLREYANQVHQYFSNKEREMQNRNLTILK